MEKQMGTTFISKKLAEVLRNYNEDLTIGNYKLTYNDNSPTTTDAAKLVCNYFASYGPIKIMDWIKVAMLINFSGLMDYRDAIQIKELMLKYFFKTGKTLNNNCYVLSSDTHICGRSFLNDHHRFYYPNTFRITLNRRRIELIINMDWWIVSVKSKTPLLIDYNGVFNPKKRVEECYCKAMPKDKIYGTYNEDNSQFTIMFSSLYKLEQFLQRLSEALKK